MTRLEEAIACKRQDLLIAHIQGEVAKVLGLNSSHLPELHQGFFEMGMDSLMSVELKTRLEASLGYSLPATLAFDFPTIKDVAGYLAREVLGWQTQATLHTLQNDADERAMILAGIEQLSQDEVEALVAKELAELETLLS